MALIHLPAETRRLIRGLKPYDIVLVLWEDAFSTICAYTLEAAQEIAGKEIYMRNTLGFIVRADNDYIVIAGTDDRGAARTHSEVADLTVLCAGFVRDVELLRRDR